jgi:hypothetical protein
MIRNPYDIVMYGLPPMDQQVEPFDPYIPLTPNGIAPGPIEPAFTYDNFLKLLGRVYDLEQQIIKVEQKLDILNESLASLPDNIGTAVVNRIYADAGKVKARKKKGKKQ